LEIEPEYDFGRVFKIQNIKFGQDLFGEVELEVVIGESAVEGRGHYSAVDRKSIFDRLLWGLRD